MKKILEAKHWQIFMLTIGLNFVLEIITLPFMILGHTSVIVKGIIPIMMILFVIGYFGWLWAISIGLQYKVPANIKMKIIKFKIFLFVSIIYMVMSIGFIEFGYNATMINGQILIDRFWGITVLLNLIFIYCIFYCLYFAAKTFKTVEMQKEVTFSNFAGEFFLFWFFPIGIWIVQPKINRMIKNKE